MKKQKFLTLGATLLITTILVSSPLLAKTTTNSVNNSILSDEIFTVKESNQLEEKLKTLDTNETKLNYINQVSKVFPMKDKISEFDEKTQTQLLKLAMPLLKEEFRIDLNNGFYPFDTQNNVNIQLIFKNDKVGSEAVRHYDKNTNTLECDVYLGVNNDDGTPTLDFYKTAKQLNVKINPSFARQFVLLHELAHCEANFRKMGSYQNNALNEKETQDFNDFLNNEKGLVIEKNHFYSYFDETFADSYAAINFLKLYNFSNESIEFIKDVIHFRKEIEAYWKNQNKDSFYDAHSSAMPLSLLIKDIENPNLELIEKLKKDTSSTVTYNLATELASSHLDDLISNPEFLKQVNNEGLEFDDNLSQIISKIKQNQNESTFANNNQEKALTQTVSYKFSKEKRELIQKSLNSTTINPKFKN